MRNKIIVLLCALFMSGCTTTGKLVSYMQSNPLVVDIATKQAVFRYINAGETDDVKLERAKHVEDVLEKVEYFLEGNPTASGATLLIVVKANIDIDQLSGADRLLVDDVLSIVESNIETSQKAGLLDESAIIRIRVLVRTLIKTAELFV